MREGKGLIVYAGDNVAPDAYNRILDKKYGLLPLPIKGVAQNPFQNPLKLNPGSAGIPAFWMFRDDDYYKGLKDVEIYKSLDLEEPEKTDAKKDVPVAASEPSDKKHDPQTIAFRFSNGKPAVVSRLVGGGEVLFVATAADKGWKRDSGEPTWTDWPIHREFIPFVHIMIGHLLKGQTQTSNVVAGEKLDWQPNLKVERAYTLVTPTGSNVRLGLPEKKNNRSVVTVAELPLAGIYRMVATLPPQARLDEPAGTAEPDKTAGVPIAVVPDLRESEDLTTLSDEEIDQRLGFRPTHITAGVETSAQGADERLNREWTTWLLAAVLLLAVAESLLAYLCGRAW